METFHTKYRPQLLDDVIGQKAAVTALKQVIAKKTSQAFLFCGPSGVGKTTLARIAAADLGVDKEGLLEIDAATNTGVDDMRAIQRVADYKPFGGSNRAIIIDECHRLSGNAWDASLKAIEEPPPGVFWFFCTTNPGKVPPTIKTRCMTLNLKTIPEKTLGILYDDICEAERIDLPGDVGDMIIREANGSARQLLVNLAACMGAKTRKEAAEVLHTVTANEPIIELARFLIKGGSWIRAMALVKNLEEENPEGIRIVICNYVGAALKGAKNDREACHFLSILDQFSVPYNAAEQMAPLLQSIGRVLFNGVSTEE